MAESPKIDRGSAADAAEARGYEHSTLPVRPVLLIAGGLAIVLVGLFIGVRWFEQHVTARPAEMNLSVVRTGQKDAAAAPPLQPQRAHDSLDAWDLQSMRAGENEVFEQLGWTPRPDGTGVRVPAAVVNELRRRQQIIATTQKGGTR